MTGGCVDVHVHAARWPTLAQGWKDWARDFGGGDGVLAAVYSDDGVLRPGALDDYLAGQGVDVAVLICEYSPRVTGIQPFEDLLPILDHNRDRFRFLAAVNPLYQRDVRAEVSRQLDHPQCAGLKVHPAHAPLPANDRAFYPAYALCQERGLPVVFHCGSTIFPGAINRYGDPLLIDELFADFPDLTVVLAHGGRGFWYQQAGFLALARDNVWIEISGLPPQRLPDYYATLGFRRLAPKMIFGTDWPGTPGARANADRVRDLDLDPEVADAILAGNARRVYRI